MTTTAAGNHAPRDLLVDSILRHAATQPDAPAVIAADGSASYRGLVDRATALAQAYRDHGAVPGDRIGIALSPGREAVAAALAAFMVRASYIPVDPSQPARRAEMMLRNSRPRLCVTHPSARNDEMPPDAAPRASLEIATTTTRALAGLWESNPRVAAPRVDRPANNDVAYVIHTSGSSGTPKGIEVEHRSLHNLISDVDRRAPVIDGYVGAWWCSPDFDVAVWELWSPLSRGGAVAVVPPEDRWDGRRLAAFLDSAEVVSAYVPPAFLYDVRDYLAARPQSCPALRRLLVGVEPIPLGVLQEIRRLRPSTTILNGYGPAETTICCTLYTVPDAEGDPTTRTPIGTAVRGNRLIVVDDYDQALITGVGELIVAGAGVARGYIDGQPYDGKGFGAAPDEQDVPAYRTGDLVEVMADGNLVYVGRVDRQLKVRGYRVEPGEIEAAIRAVTNVRDVVVDQRDLPHVGPAVVAYVVPVVDEPVDPVLVRERLVDRLPPYAVPIAIIPAPRLPLTPNGKVDRVALGHMPIPEPSGPPSIDDPTDSGYLSAVRRIWQEILGGAVEQDAGFVALGGTSLLAVRASAALQAATGRPVSTSDVLYATSAADLAQRLAASPRHTSPLSLATGRDHGPLSLNQLGVWLHDKATPGESTYLEPLCFAIDGTLDIDRLSTAIARAAAVRPAFGGVIDAGGIEPRIVLGRHRIELKVTPVPTEVNPVDLIHAETGQPIGLDGGPLVRCLLLTSDPTRHLLLLLWHHIIVDGWTVRHFLQDVGECYRQPDYRPTPPAVTVCDTNVVLRGIADHPDTAQRAERVADGLGSLTISMPNPRAPHDEPGPLIDLSLSTSIVEHMERAARHTGLGLFAFVCTAFQLAVAEVLQRHDFTIGCAVAGRTQPAFEPVAGCFVNTILVPSQIFPGRSRSALVADTARALRWARDTQEDIPFPLVVSRLRAAGCPIPVRMPQVYLSLDDDYTLTLDDLTCEAHPAPVHRARFDLTMALRHRPSSLRGVVEYRLCMLSEVQAVALVHTFERAATELAQIALTK